MPFYTRNGDQGQTTLLGGKQISKSDVIFEVIGNVDEADAMVGMARSICQTPDICQTLFQVQEHLKDLMTDIASSQAEPGKQIVSIGETQVAWLEKCADQSASTYPMPEGFIVPGDSFPAAVLDMARCIVRRAERSMVNLLEQRSFHNPFVLQYLNRLSSLCFSLELQELSLHPGNKTCRN